MFYSYIYFEEKRAVVLILNLFFKRLIIRKIGGIKVAINTFDKDETIPTEIATTGLDWVNHIAGFYNTDTQLKTIIQFEGHIDLELMLKSIRLTIDCEPILGCKFIEHEKTPTWGKIKNIDCINWCIVKETNNRQDAIEEFLTSRVAPIEIQFAAKIIRTTESDTLCIMLNHSSSDAAGIKYYLTLLSEIYNKLYNNNSFLSDPSTIRGTEEIFKNLGITDLGKAWNPNLGSSKPTWAFPYSHKKEEASKVSIHKIEQEDFFNIYAYGKSRNVTFNDMMLTAFYRSLFQLINPTEKNAMEVTTTVDLRRYLSKKNKAQSICNLSAQVPIQLPMFQGESFESTLKRVSAITENLKNNNPGINNAITSEMLRGMGYKNVVAFFKNSRNQAVMNRKASPLFSNMGIISKNPLTFGNTEVKESYIVSPLGYAPNFAFAFNTYNNIVTMTVNYQIPTTSVEDVETFFVNFKKEILSIL